MTLHHGDAFTVLSQFEPNTIDSLVTDPPAGISFMGKEWDHHKGGRNEWIAWMESVMRECLRVMKPGAHGLVWAIPRTSHWTATALENAGFEIRDSVLHIFGSGFPKSLNVGKQTGIKEHEGLGTALKPAHEVWWLIRKPCSEKTVAANVLKHGTGALNIDASRIEGQKRSPEFKNPQSVLGYNGVSTNKNLVGWDASQGRFPANLVFSHSLFCTDDTCSDECAVKALDEQSGERKSSGFYKGDGSRKDKTGVIDFGGTSRPGSMFNDSGGASRFFYCAKISSSERNAGMDGLKNNHPTIKSKKLMSYLIRMITPPGGTVLDPFMGSGSTGLAAKETGFNFIGIEKESEYFEIAKRRVNAC